MRDSKKALLVSLVFAFSLFVGSAAIIVPYVSLNDDKYLRNDLAGTIDYTIVGASHGLCAFVPSILDEEMNVNSYNLCGTLTTFNGRKALLEEEIDRNPLSTVVIELSYDTLPRQTNDAEGNTYIIPRLNGAKAKFDYLIRNFSIFDLDTPYGEYFSNGVNISFDIAKYSIRNIGNIKNVWSVYERSAYSEVEKERKGFMARTPLDASLEEDTVKSSFNSVSINREYNEENIQALSEIVSACKKRGIRVIFVMVPVSDREIWVYDNWDAFHSDLQFLSDSFGCPFFDFNLMKSRYQLFSDDGSYWGASHFCESGARTFSKEFASIMNKYDNGEDISGLFYSNYEELRSDSPYWKYNK